MLGAIAGDIIGSVYEANPIKTTRFRLFSRSSHFTDDTVLSVAVADCLLHGGDYADAYMQYWQAYPYVPYGGSFSTWALSASTEPYNSWGNGSAMRVSPVGFAFSTMDEVLEEARRSAVVTHNHPEGIRGAQATAAAIFLARDGNSKENIRDHLESAFGYDLRQSLETIRPDYEFDVSCQGSVPQSIIAFLESEDYESAVRNAISLGGDADTMACIAGGIAEAYYQGVPRKIEKNARSRLDDHLRHIVDSFRAYYQRG